MNRGLLVLVVAAAPLLATSCTTHGRSALSRPESPAPAAVAPLPRLDRDFVRYRAEVLADGTEIWHTDYVYYYLVEKRSGRLRLGADGRPLAAGLLASQTLAFMGAHHGLDAGAAWVCRVSRRIQYCRDGRVLKTEPPVIVDDVDVQDLWSLGEADGGH